MLILLLLPINKYMNNNKQSEYIESLPQNIELLDPYNGRSKMKHHCALCDSTFVITKKKMNQIICCPDCNIEKEQPLTITSYVNMLPRKKRLYENIKSIDVPSKHKCMYCKKIFSISPIDFYNDKFICKNCGRV